MDKPINGALRKLAICAGTGGALLPLLLFALWGLALPDRTAPVGDGYFAAEDLNGEWDDAVTRCVSLTESKSYVNSDVFFENGEFLFLRQGVYVVSGTLTDGALVIHAGRADTVRIILSGVTLHCNDNAAIRVEQAGKVILTLAPGAENRVSSGGDFSRQALKEKWNGAICAKSDLTINGGGALVVNADYGHGVSCDGNLRVTGGDITVNAASDGFHAHESVRITEGADKTRLSVTTGTAKGCQGIEANAFGGFIYVAGGTVSILKSCEGMEAAAVTIAGGDVDIRAADDGINASDSKFDPNKSSESKNPAVQVRVTGGSLTIQDIGGADVDGIDSNHSVFIDGGETRVSVRAGSTHFAVDHGRSGVFEINGGKLIACGGGADANTIGFVGNSAESLPSLSSKSPSITMYLLRAAPAGSQVILRSSNGKELLQWDSVPRQFTSVTVSAPEMKIGKSYILTIGETKKLILLQEKRVILKDWDIPDYDSPALAER